MPDTAPFASSAGALDPRWQSAPLAAFRDLVQSPDFMKTSAARYPSDLPVRTSSAAVYTFMFAKFVRFLQDEEKPGPERTRTRLGTRSAPQHPAAATVPWVSAFLDEVDADAFSEIRWRYVRLLERVYEHLLEHGAVDMNPVTSVIHERMQTRGRQTVLGSDNPMAWIAESEQARLLQHIGTLAASDAWKDRRDAALVAVLLGAGLRPSEALLLRKSDVQIQGSNIVLDISKGLGTGKARRTRLLADAAAVLAPWVQERPAGDLLFPGTLKSRKPMSPSTIYLRIDKLFTEAGLDPRHRGGRTLRNSFAVKLLAEGLSPDKVGEVLGLQEEKSIRRYTEAPGAVVRTPREKKPGRPWLTRKRVTSEEF